LFQDFLFRIFAQIRSNCGENCDFFRDFSSSLEFFTKFNPGWAGVGVKGVPGVGENFDIFFLKFLNFFGLRGALRFDLLSKFWSHRIRQVAEFWFALKLLTRTDT
jgi:hypothetical protein